MNLSPGSRDLVRIVLGVLLILVLISGALSILRPFLSALIWATMIVVATWPLLLQLQRALGGRRAVAAAAMTALLFVIVIAPLAVAISTLLQQAARRGCATHQGIHMLEGQVEEICRFFGLPEDQYAHSAS